MLTYKEFGDTLFTTEDLDPIYCILTRANLEENLEKRLLLAYWCYYSLGVAAAIASQKDFYIAMWKAYNEKCPRGMERRYFYGKQAEKCIQGLQDTGQPEAIVDHMTIHKDFQSAAKAVQSYRGFGPWMAWKVTDMAERVLRIPVDFSNSTLGIYKDPVMGAAWIKFGDKHHPITEQELDNVVLQLEKDFSGHLAPPHRDRPVNIQEVETVLCKYKAHCFGHYPLGKDTEDIAHGLRQYRSDLGDELLKFMVKEE